MELVDTLLKWLPARWRAAVEAYYNLDRQGTRTLNDVVHWPGVPRERIRQLRRVVQRTAEAQAAHEPKHISRQRACTAAQGDAGPHRRATITPAGENPCLSAFTCLPRRFAGLHGRDAIGLLRRIDPNDPPEAAP